MKLHIDPGEFRAVIDVAVSEAVRRLQAERHTDDAGRILLTKVEAAQALGISPSTLDRLRRDAGLPAVKLNNGLVLFRPESLKAWAAARERGRTTIEKVLDGDSEINDQTKDGDS